MVFDEPKISIQHVFDLYFNEEIQFKDLLSMLNPYKLPDDVKIEFQNSWLFEKNQFIYIDVRKRCTYVFNSKGDNMMFGVMYKEKDKSWSATGMYIGQFNKRKNRFIIPKDQFKCPF